MRSLGRKYFSLLAYEAFLKGAILKEKNLLQGKGGKFFPLRLAPFEKGGNYFQDRGITLDVYRFYLTDVFQQVWLIIKCLFYNGTRAFGGRKV